MSDLSYPIGKFDFDATVSAAAVPQLIDEIAAAPHKLRAAVTGLSEAQLDTPYRPDGWTVRQVVHHVPDSHLNAYTRFKLGLTESEPTIRPYFEDRWARLADVRLTPIDTSLALLDSLHERWVLLLRSLSASDLERTIQHPEYGHFDLKKLIGLYAWHGQHHTAHVTSLRQRMGWK